MRAIPMNGGWQGALAGAEEDSLRNAPLQHDRECRDQGLVDSLVVGVVPYGAGPGHQVS